MAESVVNAEGPDGQHGGGDATRRDFIHIAAGAAAAGAGVMVAWPLINQMNPAADTLALASIEFDLTKVQEGQQVVIKWQGKPVFVRYRTPAELTKVIERAMTSVAVEGSILVAIAVVLSLALMSRALRPVERINAAMKRIAAEKFSKNTIKKMESRQKALRAKSRKVCARFCQQKTKNQSWI